jgi:hypothetical protein
MKSSVRYVSAIALLAIIALLVVQVGVIGDVDSHVNTTTVVLTVLALVLGFAVAAPQSVKEVIDRMTSLKLPGGIEIGLQAATRAERIQAQMPRSTDDVKTTTRPRSGGPRSEYHAVQAKLQERLRFTRDAIFDLPRDRDYKQIVEHINGEKLLETDELHLVYDILGRLESDVEKLPPQLLEEYLDASWRFSVRFGTLVFERLVRKRLTETDWFLMDFQQARSHRPDFLAYRRGVFLFIASRVEPAKTLDVRKRLMSNSLPFGAAPVVVVPDSRPFEPDDSYAAVPVVTLQKLLERD